jgi:HSP20 family protein
MMANLMRRNRPSMLNTRRDIEDLVDEFEMPRRFRSEISRLFGEDLSMRELWDEMDRLMNDFTSPPSLRRRIEGMLGSQGGGGRGMGMYMPAIDVSERDNEYLLRVDLPGIREQDLDVSIDDDNVLTVSGERHEEEKRNDRGYEYTERTYGSFCRTVELPRGVDASKIESDFRNGVLELRVPKGEARGTRRLQIGRNREGGRSEEPRVIAPGSQQGQQSTQMGQQGGNPQSGGQQGGSQQGGNGGRSGENRDNRPR